VGNQEFSLDFKWHKATLCVVKSNINQHNFSSFCVATIDVDQARQQWPDPSIPDREGPLRKRGRTRHAVAS
jgi:hypothetical protein